MHTILIIAIPFSVLIIGGYLTRKVKRGPSFWVEDEDYIP